jgi:hypothetical protein
MGKCGGGGIKDECQVSVGLLCVEWFARFSLSVCRRGIQASANHNLTPGKYPKEYIQYSKHGESLKSFKKVLHVSIYDHRQGAHVVPC